MKYFWILLIALAASAYAGPTISGDTVQTQPPKWEKETSALFKEPKPNQIISGNVTYSGILIEIAKVDNPLQLLNPAAPAQYGEAEENLVRDPISNNPSGLKFFSIQF